MPRSPLRTVLLLAACVALGAMLGLGGLALGFKYLPSELGRLRVIGDALDGLAEGEPPAAAVLGSSVVMNGVNGAVVAEALPGPVWNLSSSGQTLLESALVLDRAAALPGIVVVSALPDELVRAGLTIRPNKVVAYRLYGYRPSPGLRAAIAAGGDEALVAWLEAPPAVFVAQGRWAIRAAFDTQLRRALRPDLAADRVASDLSFPARYTRPIPTATLRVLLERRFRPRPAAAAVLSPRAGEALRHVAGAARAGGACPVLLVLPEHPRRRETTAPAFYDRLGAQLDELSAEAGLGVIDLAAALDDPALFNDHIHPNARGAERLSQALGDALARACPSGAAR